MNDLLLWGDVETSGFKPTDSALLEVGFRATDLNGDETGRFQMVVGFEEAALRAVVNASSPYVQDMHRDNGLFRECSESDTTLRDVDHAAAEWIRAAGVEDQTLCGASMKLDRDFMEACLPETYSLIHYRTIDNSTLKEMCRRYNPELFKHLPEKETDHRVNTCLDGSIEEFQWYIENFIFDGRTDGRPDGLLYDYPVVGQS